jgi:transposase
MGNFLTPSQIEILQEAHRASLGRKQADRIKAILFLNEGFSYVQTAKLLMLDEITIRRYQKHFEKQGIDGLLEDRYHGSDGYLTKAQEEEFTHYLKGHTYQTVKAICAYVEATYHVTYSIDGMTHLLHRLRFVYKKTKALPGKVNVIKQEEFKKRYQHLKNTKKPEDKIYFLDASHPHHNNMPFYGWIFKGVTKTIKTNTGRGRLNLNGALNLEEMKITVLSEKTINTHSMMRLVLTIEEKQATGEIYLIVDNASYNHSYELELFLRDHPRAHLLYLPPYSPNLNIIERLWKFFHEKYRDRYFEKFKEFEASALSFFENIHQHDEELRKRLTDSFQTLPAF